MRKIKILLLLIIVIFVSGCAKKVDIDKMAIINTIGFDKSEEGIKLVVQVVNPNILIPNPPEVSPIYITSVEGKTVLECLVKLTGVFASKPFLLSLQLIVFSEEVAKEGINDYLHFLVNYRETQHQFVFVIAKDSTAEELLSQISLFSIHPTQTIIRKIQSSSESYGVGVLTLVEEVYNDVRSSHGALTLSSITIEGDKEEGSKIDQKKGSVPKAKILVSALGYFKKDKLIGWLTEEESIYYHYIKNKIINTVLVVSIDEKHHIANEIKNVNTSIKIELVNNKPKIIIKTKCEVTVVEDTKGIILLNKKYIDDVELAVKNELTKNINSLIDKSQKEIRIDIFGFSDYIERRQYKYWLTIKENYDEIYETIDIEVIVEPKISRVVL